MNTRDKKPVDPAPDWVGHTWAHRLSNDAIQLHLFGLLSKEDTLSILLDIERWCKE